MALCPAPGAFSTSSQNPSEASIFAYMPIQNWSRFSSGLHFGGCQFVHLKFKSVPICLQNSCAQEVFSGAQYTSCRNLQQTVGFSFKWNKRWKSMTFGLVKKNTWQAAEIFSFSSIFCLALSKLSKLEFQKFIRYLEVIYLKSEENLSFSHWVLDFSAEGTGQGGRSPTDCSCCWGFMLSWGFWPLGNYLTS